MTATNWRTIRSRLTDTGIADPMVEFSSMHRLLDAAEKLAIESATAEAKTATEARAAVRSLWDKLYKPDTPVAAQLNGEGYLPPPPGFSDEEVEASFDAFLSQPR